MESRDSEGMPFASLESLCHAFGRYRPMNGAEKWSRDHDEFAYTHVEKITDSKNAILSIYMYDEKKIMKLSRKNRFRTVASPGAWKRLAVLN